jgi:microsomal dipeptidase-like Zn-dependent dipeptidase
MAFFAQRRPRGSCRHTLPVASPARRHPHEWFVEVHHLGRIPDGLRKAGFSPSEVEKIASGNWLRLYGEVFAGAPA